MDRVARNGENVNKKFSTRDPHSQEIHQLLEKENAQLKEDVENLKELLKLQRTVTNGTKFTKTSVQAAAQWLKKNANAKGDTKELMGLLNTFYEKIATSGTGSKPENSEYAREVLQQIRGSRIYLDESQKAEVAHRFGSFNDFRKSMMGSLTTVNDGNTSLDSFWQEISKTYQDCYFKKRCSSF